MKDKSKSSQEVAAQSVAEPIRNETANDLFQLYVARVAKAETVRTMRRDARAIFTDAFKEAKIALDVFRELTEQEDK